VTNKEGLGVGGVTGLKNKGSGRKSDEKDSLQKNRKKAEKQNLKL